jgi:hypothetical protein
MASTTGNADAGRDGAIHFPLQQNEQVIEVCRKHWWYLWPRAAWYAVLALAPVIIIAVIVSKIAGLDGTVGGVFWIIALVYLVYWAVRIFLNWYRYHNDIWVITNQRLIDSTKTTPFRMKMSSADLVNVQDMTVERNGIFATMFHFGDVVCQTAAEVGEFRMVGVPHPQEIQLLVDKERDRERLRARGG